MYVSKPCVLSCFGHFRQSLPQPKSCVLESNTLRDYINTSIHTYWEFARRINIDINSCATHRIGIPNRICMSETLEVLCMFKINTCRCLMSPIQATYRVCCWGCKECFHIDDPRLCLYAWKHSRFQTCIHAQASSRQTHALGDVDMGGAHKLNLY